MSEPKLQSPIVLVHGLLGITQLQLHGWVIASYFPGITEALIAAGNRVFVPQLSLTGSVAERAGELKNLIEANLGADGPLHVIAHSMGGLDSRYMISQLGMAERVLTLTTLGTPHRGTSFADWGTKQFGPVVRPFLDHFGIETQAFYDLTRPKCAAFNQDILDDARVRYFSVAGAFQPDLLTPEWWLSYGIIHEQEGANDGLVAVESAKWGTFLGTWDADHAGLINWPNPVARARGLWHDRVPDYLNLVSGLADQGF